MYPALEEKHTAMKVTILVDGKPVEGDRVPFTPIEEPWTKHKLQDGTIVRMKLVVADVVRLTTKDDDGNPHYIVKSSNILAVDSPGAPSGVH